MIGGISEMERRYINRYIPGEGIKEGIQEGDRSSGIPTIQGHMRNGATRRSTGAHSHIPCGGGSVCCSATMDAQCYITKKQFSYAIKT